MAQCSADAVSKSRCQHCDPENITPLEVANAVEMFSPIAYRHGDGQWTRLSRLNTPRVLAGVVVVGNILLTVGELSLKSFGFAHFINDKANLIARHLYWVLCALLGPTKMI